MTQGSLATRLRVLRARRGLSLTDAANLAGIQRQTLARLERGEQRPHDVTLSKIAAAYDVDVEHLLDLGDEPPVPKAEAPQLTMEQFADHNIQLTSDELAVLNELLKIYTEKAQTGAKRGNFLVPPGVDVDVDRLTMLFNYAVESGMLSPEDVEVLRTGIRARLKAGAT